MQAQTTARENRTERLETRVPASLKSLVQRAAALQGQSLTDFVLAAATEAARRVVRENDVLELSYRDQMAFAEALLHPPEPNDALKAAAARYLDESR
jgi:uncharacterized protein (DUF1778 family)